MRVWPLKQPHARVTRDDCFPRGTNTFLLFPARVKEVDFSLKQKQLEDTEDAESEITFADDDSKCDLVLGECFFETEKSKAEEMLRTKSTSERKSIEENKEELTSVERAMEQLKGHLYGKFGSSINLEE
jgi:prefoldin subunit 4